MIEAPPELIVSLACDTAARGPCEKSKRGVVIYGPDPNGEVPAIFGNAFNSQPWPYECDKSDACKAACGRLCVHAEQRAILQMLSPAPTDLARFIHDRTIKYPDPGSLSLVHVKVVEAKLVPSGGPSCDQCSKLIVENKWIGAVWLYEEVGAMAMGGGGVATRSVAIGEWCRYSPEQFHRRTLLNCGLPITL